MYGGKPTFKYPRSRISSMYLISAAKVVSANKYGDKNTIMPNTMLKNSCFELEKLMGVKKKNQLVSSV